MSNCPGKSVIFKKDIIKIEEEKVALPKGYESNTWYAYNGLNDQSGDYIKLKHDVSRTTCFNHMNNHKHASSAMFSVTGQKKNGTILGECHLYRKATMPTTDENKPTKC